MKLVLVTETYSPEINGVAMTLGRLVDGLAARTIVSEVLSGKSAVTPCPPELAKA